MPCARKDEPAWRLAIVLRDGFACLYCRADLRSAKPRMITLDHLEPASAGGTHDPANLVTACRSCNSARMDRPWRKFAGRAATRRIKATTAMEPNLELARAFIAGRVEAP
jgi:5-methylcytosine-specific restriction endonuclease McrA